MSALWIATLGASAACYLIKFLGHSLPVSLLEKERVQRIVTLIPVVLLSSLVGVQTLTNKNEIVIDHRLAGVLVAGIALRFKAPFPVMMALAGLTSALIYRFF